jgi:glycerophosphoryl diester phosphodiesterase
MSVDVQAHRGLSATHPENTIAAFRAAADAGFPTLEMDVRCTHDGEVLVLHDPTLTRTTDGVGRLHDLDYDEVRRYDTGVGPVPRLADVFAALASWKGQWNVEIKAEEAAEGAVGLVGHHGLGGRTIFTAIDPDVVAALADLAPDVPRGLIPLGPPDDEDFDAAADLGCAWINVDVDFWDDAIVARAREHNLRVGAWTVNDAAIATRLVAAGVQAIITDTVDVLRAVLTRPVA